MSGNSRADLVVFAMLAASCIGSADASAQDLEPRAFSNAPVGLNFALVGYVYSAGNLLFDDALAAALQIQSASAKIHQGALSFVRTVDVFGLSGRVGAVVPLVTGRWEGIVADTFATVSRDGLGDPRLLFSVGFLGAPALSGADFVRYTERTVVGASLQIIVPLGQYDPSRLINLGSNRWAFKPRLGLSHTHGRWTFEFFGAVWLFTDNADALGQRIEQDPIFALQGHAIYAFRRGLWLAVDAGYGSGGRSRVGGEIKDDFRKDTRLGAQLAVPLARRHSLKLIYFASVSTRIGADFDTISLLYQLRWGAGL
ncbi:MAG: transporter [Gemmatimonadota bacterium]|nr:MAG: transporter [Gemmatimonadota bacterium]